MQPLSRLPGRGWCAKPTGGRAQLGSGRACKAIGACTGVGFVGSSCALFVGPLLMAYAHPALPFLLNAIMLACGAVLICALARETARAALAE